MNLHRSERPGKIKTFDDEMVFYLLNIIWTYNRIHMWRKHKSDGTYLLIKSGRKSGSRGHEKERKANTLLVDCNRKNVLL